MATLDDILASAQRARLIPTVATTRKEERLASVLLAAMSVVRPLAESILTQCGTRMGKRAVLETYTEVTFSTADGNENRPDGVLRLTAGRSTWTALVEAKVDKAELDAEQMERYARTAREFGVDAILTLSNQLVALPTHIPYALPKRLARHVECFHISWVSILTEASILLRDKEAMDPGTALDATRGGSLRGAPEFGCAAFRSDERSVATHRARGEQGTGARPLIARRGAYGRQLASRGTRRLPDPERTPRGTGSAQALPAASDRARGARGGCLPGFRRLP